MRRAIRPSLLVFSNWDNTFSLITGVSTIPNNTRILRSQRPGYEQDSDYRTRRNFYRRKTSTRWNQTRSDPQSRPSKIGYSEMGIDGYLFTRMLGAPSISWSIYH